jgi:hypothetical protein
MGNDTMMGKHCSYLNMYVPENIQDYQNQLDNSNYTAKSCSESTCKNTQCRLNRNYIGDRLKRLDCLEKSSHR